MKSNARLVLLVASTLLAGLLPVVQAFRISQHHAADLATKAVPAPAMLVASR